MENEKATFADLMSGKHTQDVNVDDNGDADTIPIVDPVAPAIKSDDIVADSVTPSATPATPPTVDANTGDASKYFGGKFKTFAEAEQVFTEYETKVAKLPEYEEKLTKAQSEQFQVHNDVVKKLNDFYATNKAGKLEDFVNIVSKDFTSMEPLAAIKEQMFLFNEAELPAEDIEWAFNKKYGKITAELPKKESFLDEDGILNEEKYSAAVEKYTNAVEHNRGVDVLVRTDGSLAKKNLIELQSKFNIVPDNTKEINDNKIAQENYENSLKTYKSEIDNFKQFSEEIVLNGLNEKKVQLVFDVEEADRHEIFSTFAGKINPYEKLGDDIKAINTAFTRDRFIAKNFDRLMSIATRQAYDMAKEDFLKERVNIDLDGKPNLTPNNTKPVTDLSFMS